MKFLRALICAGLLALQFSPALAFWHGNAGLANNSALSGIVGFDSTMFPFVNFMKEAGSFPTQTGTTFIYPNNLLNGSNLPDGSVSQRIAFSALVPTNYFGQYVFSINGTVGGNGVQFATNGVTNQPGQVYAIGAGTTISGCNNGNVPPCYAQSGLTITGTNPQVTFDLSSPVTGAINSPTTPGLVRLSIANTSLANAEAVTVSGVVGSDGNGCGANGTFTLSNRSSTTVDLVGSTFNTGASCTYTSGGQLFIYQSTASFALIFNWAASSTWSSMTSAVMCKLADFNVDSTCNTDARHSWAGGFNDDFVGKLATLRLHHIRYLDVNNTLNIGVPPDWNGWETSSAWSYGLSHDWWVISNWFGSDSGTNAYSIACSNGQACTYKLTAGAPVDGDLIQFYNTNANTTANPTITITDANSVTSSAIPIYHMGATQEFIKIGGTLTIGDTVSLTFNTTPVSAGTCLAGSTHTTSVYTVVGGDTLGSVANSLFAIVSADATLTAQNTAVFSRNPNGGSGTFQVGWASNACTVTISANITGSATETVTIGPSLAGSLATNTLYSATYNGLLKAFLLENDNPTAGGTPPAWPWLTQLQLAQAVSTKSGLQVGCWLQTPLIWSTASFTSLVNLAVANQCPGGTYFELSNEVWNTATFIPPQAIFMGTSVGLKGDNAAYYELRQRQLWGIASSSFGGIAGNFNPVSAWQVGFLASSELTGNTLCGTSCGNQAYQNAIGVDYNSGPNRPIDFTRHLSQAPYYHGGIVSGNFGSSGSYGSWSATSSSVAGNVLTVNGIVTGTIWPNQGIATCDGTYIATTSPGSTGSFPSAQLTGTVTTTLNGAIASDNTHTWTLTSNAGLSPGMWIYNATTGSINATIVAVLGGNQITAGAAGTGKVYRSAGSNDTIIFGGGAGTYRLNSTSCSIASGTITGGDVLGLQYMADNYCTASSACSTGNVGLGSVQDAYNWLAQDIIAGAKNNQSDLGTSNAGNIWAFQQIGALASSFSINSQSYEGGYDGFAPTTTQATSMGLPSSSYGMTGNSSTPTWDGYIGQAIFAFKNNTTFKTAVTSVHNQELAFEPVNSMTQWYVFSGNSRWSLFNTPGDGLYAPTYQSYNAICNYNGGSC